MGHKVHPRIFRTPILYAWGSRWFSRKQYSHLLEQDIKIREYLKKRCREAGVGSIEIERGVHDITVMLAVAKPGVIIGRGGSGIEDIKKEIQKKFLKKTTEGKTDIKLNVVEVAHPSLSAAVVVDHIASEIERRVAFRRAMKQTIERVMKAGGLGVKLVVSGRLDGAEIARREKLAQGKVPLHTIRADIDYAQGVARTAYGAIGIKVWIYKGEVFHKEKQTSV